MSLHSNTRPRRIANSSPQSGLAQVVEIALFQRLILQGHPFLLCFQSEPGLIHDFWWCEDEVRLPQPGAPSCGISSKGIAAINLFVAASASFRLLYVMIILAHDRRKIARTAVTEHPTQLGSSSA